MLKVDNGKIFFEVKDSVLRNDIIVLDLVANMENLVNFIEYYKFNHSNNNIVEVALEEEKHSVSFGTFIYDKNGNVRLYLSSSNGSSEEKNSLSPGVFAYNQEYLLLHQEKRLNYLVDLLTDKGIISDNELSLLDSYFSVSKESFDIDHEVPDLQKYIEVSNSSIEDITRLIDSRST